MVFWFTLGAAPARLYSRFWRAAPARPASLWCGWFCVSAHRSPASGCRSAPSSLSTAKCAKWFSNANPWGKHEKLIKPEWTHLLLVYGLVHHQMLVPEADQTWMNSPPPRLLPRTPPDAGSWSGRSWSNRSSDKSDASELQIKVKSDASTKTNINASESVLLIKQTTGFCILNKLQWNKPRRSV